MYYQTYITEQIARGRQRERLDEALRQSKLNHDRRALPVASEPDEVCESQVRGVVRQEMGPVTR